MALTVITLAIMKALGGDIHAIKTASLRAAIFGFTKDED
jgi:hypothetical protein